MEKTNDRDYEVEERLDAFLLDCLEPRTLLTYFPGDTVPWRQRQCVYKKRPRAISILCEVGIHESGRQLENMFD